MTSFSFGHQAQPEKQETFDFLPPVAPGIERALRSPIAASSDPDTSHLAAKAVTESGQREGQLLAVLAVLKKYPRLTSMELAHHASEPDKMRFICARRLPELERGGLVRRAGKRECSISGMKATIWEAI